MKTSHARGLFWRLARAGPIWPAQAFAAIAETLPLGSVAIEPERVPDGIRRWLIDKPEMEPEALAEVRARLERVLATLVADGRVWLERPRVVEDLRALLAEIDRRAGARPGAGDRQSRLSALSRRAVPAIDLTNDELAAVTAALRGVIEDDKYPLSPRLDPLRAALGKLDAAAEPAPPTKAPPPAKADKRARR